MSAALVSIVYDSGFGHPRKTVAKDVDRVSGLTAQLSAAGGDTPCRCRPRATPSFSIRRAPLPRHSRWVSRSSLSRSSVVDEGKPT